MEKYTGREIAIFHEELDVESGEENGENEEKENFVKKNNKKVKNSNIKNQKNNSDDEEEKKEEEKEETDKKELDSEEITEEGYNKETNKGSHIEESTNQNKKDENRNYCSDGQGVAAVATGI